MGARHGQSGTALYAVWHGIKARCLTPSCTKYDRYGGLGIRICDDWLQFMPFYEWAIANGYQPGLFIDRIENSLGYFPENCRWVTKSFSNVNRVFASAQSFRGIRKNGKRWAAAVTLHGKRINLGSFPTPEDAARAYDTKAIELHGEFAQLNFARKESA